MTLRLQSAQHAGERHPRVSVSDTRASVHSRGSVKSQSLVLPQNLADREAAAAASKLAYIENEGENIQLNPLYGVKSDIYMY